MLVQLVCSMLYQALFVSTARDFDYVSDSIKSFTYGDRQVLIWPSVTNGPGSPASHWSFRYGPLIAPLLDENNTVQTTRTKYGSRWRTSFFLTLDDPVVKALAFNVIRATFPDVKGLLLESVWALPVEKITVTIPGLFHDFPDANFTPSAEPCQERASCFAFFTQPTQFRVSLFTPTEKRALELEEVLRLSQINLKIETYTRVLSVGGTHSEENPLSLDSLNDQLDLSSITAGTSSIFRRMQVLENNLSEVQEKHQVAFAEVVTMLKNTSNNMKSELDPASSSLADQLANWSTSISNRLNTRLDKIDLDLELQKTMLSNISSDLASTSANLRSQVCLSLNLGGKKYCNSTGHCNFYAYISQGMDWVAANEKCKGFGAQLVSISSTAENAFVRSLWTDDLCPYIGLSDEQEEGNFVWLGGSRSAFRHWGSGQPDGGKRENCVAFCNQLKWYDVPCTDNRPFICKAPDHFCN